MCKMVNILEVAMRTKHKRIEAGLKAKAALAAVREDCTASQLASKFGVHATQIGHWKRRLVERAVELFSDDRQGESQDQLFLLGIGTDSIGRRGEWGSS
jgi:transposase-like protein